VKPLSSGPRPGLHCKGVKGGGGPGLPSFRGMGLCGRVGQRLSSKFGVIDLEGALL
jgi:hypothetical protein